MLFIATEYFSYGSLSKAAYSEACSQFWYPLHSDLFIRPILKHRPWAWLTFKAAVHLCGENVNYYCLSGLLQLPLDMRVQLPSLGPEMRTALDCFSPQPGPFGATPDPNCYLQQISGSWLQRLEVGSSFLSCSYRSVLSYPPWQQHRWFGLAWGYHTGTLLVPSYKTVWSSPKVLLGSRKHAVLAAQRFLRGWGNFMCWGTVQAKAKRDVISD